MFRALLRCSHLAQLAAASSGERSQRRAGDRQLFLGRSCFVAVVAIRPARRNLVAAVTAPSGFVSTVN